MPPNVLLAREAFIDYRNATTRHAAEDTEAVPVRVKEHLVCLQQVGPDQRSPTVR
ncbi:hypothetical protein AGR1C_pTi0153 [Agrobacterium fabacearum TT111]|nr:hypothetical protein AGR1C_pTi0153 [Agrobacterium fabacearum TT111]